MVQDRAVVFLLAHAKTHCVKAFLTKNGIKFAA